MILSLFYAQNSAFAEVLIGSVGLGQYKHIVTNSTELQNSRNSKFPYYFSFQRSAKLRRVCAWSQTKLSFKIREIANFHIISHFSGQ